MLTILCPVDFTDSSENMVRYVLKLNQTLKARLVFLHVYESPVAYTLSKFARDQDFELFKRAHARLGTIKKGAHENELYKKYEIELAVKTGLASEKIIATAIEQKVSLIVMGASTLSSVERLVIGSNASAVVKKAPCMVMIIPSTYSFSGMKRIVYATDRKADNLAAGRALERFSKRFDAGVAYVYVTPSKEEIDDSYTLAKSKRASLTKRPLHFVYANTVNNGLGGYLHNANPNCLAVFHRARNIFGAITDPSLSTRISFSCTTPVLILHKNDRPF